MLKAVLEAISMKQHGFIPGRFTVTNLTLFTNSIFSSLNRNKQLDTIYLDFKKAFDLINNKILLLKLSKYNLSSSIIRWLGDYLFERNFHVQIKGTKSHKFIAPSGVLQGSQSPWSVTIFTIY